MESNYSMKILAHGGQPLDEYFYKSYESEVIVTHG